MNPRKKPKFVVPNYKSKGRSRLLPRWRKQRGIDNKSRIKRQGYKKEPNIGYGAPKELKYKREDGKYEVVVHNEKELRSLIGKNDVVAKFSSTISKKKRLYLQKIADENKIKIINKVVV